MEVRRQSYEGGSSRPAQFVKSVEAGHDFSSDVGRKKFGFSREEILDSSTYYEGQFKLYQRCGQGTLHSPETGAKYVGQFQGDYFHGEGHQVWSDGSKYKGQWKQGQKHGKGDFVTADSLLYSGQWENGLRHGQGSQEYANGDRFTGWFYHGLCSGPGSYDFADGAHYEGTWANGRYDGPGMLTSYDGSRERQVYSAGVLVKREVLPSGQASSSRGKAARASKSDNLLMKALMSQKRDDMHKPTLMPKIQPSKYLIRRETATMDLTAPALTRPQTVGNTTMRVPAMLPGMIEDEDPPESE